MGYPYMLNESPAASRNTYSCGNCGWIGEYDDLDYLPFSTIKCCPVCHDYTRIIGKRKEVAFVG